MKDFSLQSYLRNNALLKEGKEVNEMYDEMDMYRQDPERYDKLHQDMKKEKDQMAKDKAAGKPVKSASTVSQNYDDYMDNAYGKDRYGMTNEKENDPYDKEHDLPGIDDKPGYDVFGGKYGPRIKNAVVTLVRGGYTDSDIVHYVRAVIKAAKQMKN